MDGLECRLMGPEYGQSFACCRKVLLQTPFVFLFLGQFPRHCCLQLTRGGLTKLV
ncbi:hypothetical protein D9M69_501490 [compost metagenome]